MDRGWLTDLRHGLRVVRRSPGFVLVAVTSLGLGIGGNAAMFGAVRSLLLNPMPVDHPGELRVLSWRRDAQMRVSFTGATSYADPDGGAPYRSNFTFPMYQEMRGAVPAGVGLFAFNFLRGTSVGVGDAPAILVGGLLASGAYFDVLRPGIALGRPIAAADDRPGAPLVAVLSHALWMRAFGGDPDAVGSTIRVNGLPAEVVGVTAEGFHGLSQGGFFPQTDITVPLAAQPQVQSQWRAMDGGPLRSDQDTFWLRVMARVPDPGSDARVSETLTTAFRGQPSAANVGGGPAAEVRLLPGARGADTVRGASARMLVVLLGVLGVVLVLVCVNLAGLMLARGMARQREMAVRRALGGGRARLIRQTFCEGLVIAGAGTAAGLVLAFAARELLGRMVSAGAGSPAYGAIAAAHALDVEVVAFAALLGVAATLLFATLPALRLSDVDPMAWLKHRSPGGGARTMTLGRALLSLQIAVSVPLLVGSALLLRTMVNLGSVDLGFEAEGMTTFQLYPAYARVPRNEWANLYLEVLEGVRRIPGVTSASLMGSAPLSGISSNSWIEMDGRRHHLYRNAVGPDYLQTTGMRLIEGRMPGFQDLPGAPLVVAVNERVARDIFGGASPVGRRLSFGSTDYEIIGVVNDSRYVSRRQEVPATIFPSALQSVGFEGNHVVVRSSLPAGRLEPALREAVRRVNPDLPLPEVTSQATRVAESNARERLFTQLLTLMGGLALLLASIGLHGAVAYSVERRTSEIGLRVAVGARPGQVQWLMLRQVLVLCVAGLALGVPAALAAGPVVGSLLYGVASNDVPTIAAASVALVAVALAAGFFPARRASTVDPVKALRVE